MTTPGVVNKTIESCVRGYYIYKDIWTPCIGDMLECKREPSNMIDRYAICVTKPSDTTVVGKNSSCLLFVYKTW